MRRFFTFLSILFCTSCIQGYWAMRHLVDSLSSVCLSCSFIEGVIIHSGLTALVCSGLFLLFSKNKFMFIRICIPMFAVIQCWLLGNYTEFVERESSWSTYSFEAELLATYYFGRIPTLVMSVVTVILLKFNFLKSLALKYV